MVLTPPTVAAESVAISLHRLFHKTEYLLQQPQEALNHNHPLWDLFSTPQPEANHPKGKNKHIMLKKNVVSKSKTLWPVGQVFENKNWENRHTICSLSKSPRRNRGAEMLSCRRWCRVRHSISPHQKGGGGGWYTLLCNLERSPQPRQSTVTWPVTPTYVEEQFDKCSELRTSSHESLNRKVKEVTRPATSDYSKIRTCHKSWGIVKQSSNNTETKNAFLWHVLPCSLVDRYLCFQGTCCPIFRLDCMLLYKVIQ